MDTQFHSKNMNSNTANYNSVPGISPHQLQQQQHHHQQQQQQHHQQQQQHHQQQQQQHHQQQQQQQQHQQHQQQQQQQHHHQHQQHPNSMPTHILPPLQPAPQASSMQPVYGKNAPVNHPRAHPSPNTPTSATSMNFPQMCQTSPRYQLLANNNNMHQRGYQMISSANDQGYRSITTVVPHAPGATQMSYPQANSSVPQNRIPPQAMRPMSHNGIHMHPSMSLPYAQNNMLQMVDMKSPTHVVGSQGRRGILPSAPGRPPVNSNTAKNGLIATKDADGKFPCPHCTKTYLHAKHLKRHLLRHTGDRPYMCILCRDTFSRSDILKRHFQKCSIRRGNPTGASHLSHSQAHVKKAQLNTPKIINERITEVNNNMATSSDGMPMYRVAPDGSVPEQYPSPCVSGLS